MILHAYVDVYVLCVCIVGHGGDYITLIPLGKVWSQHSQYVSFETETSG